MSYIYTYTLQIYIYLQSKFPHKLINKSKNLLTIRVSTEAYDLHKLF